LKSSRYSAGIVDVAYLEELGEGIHGSRSLMNFFLSASCQSDKKF